MTAERETLSSKASRPVRDAAFAKLPPDTVLNVDAFAVAQSLLVADSGDWRFEVKAGGLQFIRDGFSVELPDTIRLTRRRHNAVEEGAQIAYDVKEVDDLWDSADSDILTELMNAITVTAGEPEVAPSVAYEPDLARITVFYSNPDGSYRKMVYFDMTRSEARLVPGFWTVEKADPSRIPVATCVVFTPNAQAAVARAFAAIQPTLEITLGARAIARALIPLGWTGELLQDAYWVAKDDAGVDMQESVTVTYRRSWYPGETVVRYVPEIAGHPVNSQAKQHAGEFWEVIRSLSGEACRKTAAIDTKLVRLVLHGVGQPSIPEHVVTESEAAVLMQKIAR